MATTTIAQSSNSLITTSSSAFTTPSAPTAAGAPGATGNAGGNDGNPNSPNIFSLDESPPLVVAFLAIGLFVVAIIGVFGWRHYSRFRSSNVHGGTTTPNRGRRRKSITLGKRPALWDLWVDLTGMTVDDDDRGRSVEQRTKWEDITPMTAVVTYMVPHARPPESSLPIKPESTVVVVDPARRFRLRAPFGTQWGRRSASAPLRRLFWPDTPSAPPPPPPPPQLAPHPMSPPPLATPPPPLLIPPSDGEGKVEGVESRTSEEFGWGDALSSVQVTVIIAMPSQRRARLLQQGTSSALEKNTDSEGTSLGEFCIGTTDVPWSECG